MKEYTPTEKELQEIERNFRTYKVDADTAEKMTRFRALFAEIAVLTVNNCPPSRERSSAITKLEEAMFWLSAGISRAEGE